MPPAPRSRNVPYLDEVVRRLVSLGYERALRAASLGSSVRLGQEQLPGVWVLHREVFNCLDIDEVPDLYLTQYPVANAFTFGSGKPVVVMNSELSACSTTRAGAWCSPTRRRTCNPTTCSTGRRW